MLVGVAHVVDKILKHFCSPNPLIQSYVYSNWNKIKLNTCYPISPYVNACKNSPWLGRWFGSFMN